MSGRFGGPRARASVSIGQASEQGRIVTVKGNSSVHHVHAGEASTPTQGQLEQPKGSRHPHGRRDVASAELAHGVLLMEANGAGAQAQYHGDLFLRLAT